ncbi:MAG: hypothetical protein BWX55_01402 [Deltaproteobacteria bacterium ADurb.Bin022]|nr:MAG: hypothetical protein BWX55_01402 [Deltaproteobacteria bacterium ADurb.Bin022]
MGENGGHLLQHQGFFSLQLFVKFIKRRKNIFTVGIENPEDFSENHSHRRQGNHDEKRGHQQSGQGGITVEKRNSKIKNGGAGKSAEQDNQRPGQKVM